ncbi:hypothetical protein PENARI_c078G05451 [Penicillium arizonense]|uniref:RING-CH-type domain-containing protein n=1 Tax=Penicillium arizonense TaxID=1835702 RepID=A0A1F5L1C3_PENAI|nr:hypothetical protein PENARI_c078G05451 [Penicillium arizonense]OGE47002.1 hypothetical protein PENARI_c078G05451 [Penicillium arizonense]
MTKKGEPCKNSIKVEDTKTGHQKLATLAREPFDLSTLQLKLCDIARDFLCARWHRQRQADQVGQQWYETAVRNQARVPHCSRMASPSVIVHPGQRQTSSASRRRPASDNTQPSPLPVPLSTNPEPVQPFNPFVTSAMLRANNVPWRVSPAQPAILASVANIWAGVQDLTLQSLTPSEEVDSIHCVFCLTEDEDHANECVILRCHLCRALSHLSCAEEWLERRDTGSGTSCCVCRNEGALDALIRPLRIPLSDAETHSVLTASDSSPDGGPRCSARLAGAHLPRDPSTSAPLRRSARLNSTQQ